MALFKYDPLPLKEVEAKKHPWARTIRDVYSNRIKHAHNSIRNPIYPGKKEKKPGRIQFTVIGDRVTKEFTYCTNLVKGLYKYRWKNFEVPIIRGCSTVEWSEVLQDLRLRFRGIAYCLQSSVAVLFNDEIIGGEKELQMLVETKLFYHLCLDYYNEGVSEFARFIRSTNAPFAYMHVSINDKHIGTLIYMLYTDIVPYTCENFLRLCKETKGGYGGTPVHRIVKDGWIQCGGFGLKSTPLSCENFIIPFDRRGVLAMAHDGRNEDCSTQFFVLLQPAPWMNHKYVAFGQLIEGAATLEKIESVTTWNESPTSKIIFYRCGIFNMDCHDIRINKGANQYIDGHTEDLNLLAEFLWEHLLEKTFLEAQLRELERLRALEGEGAEASSQDDDPVKMPGEKADENHEFDVEEIEFKEEEEDYSYTHQLLHFVSPVEKSQRPYYIPLTDVPYLGDVESDFDLKKFLKGDYCLASDVYYKKGEVAEFPTELWEESESSSPTPEELSMSMDSEEQLELDMYLKNNVDRVSFGGGVIKNITQEKTDPRIRAASIITDEKLRKMRLALAEHQAREASHKKTVSMMEARSAHDAEKAHQIKRRQTGFIRPQDLQKLLQHFREEEEEEEEEEEKEKEKEDEEEDYEEDDEEDDEEEEEEEEEKEENEAEEKKEKKEKESSGKGITFGNQNMKSGPSRKIPRRLTTYNKSKPEDDDDGDYDGDDDTGKDDVVEEESPSKPMKESVLLRLYDEVNVDNEQGPTLKNYIPTAEIQHKNLLVLTQYTPLFEAGESREHYKRQSVESKQEPALEHVLNLRHGAHMSRKISTDYVKTMEMDEKPRSIRSVEYAKRRPTISVSDYQLENMRYQEHLKRTANLGSWWVSFWIRLSIISITMIFSPIIN